MRIKFLKFDFLNFLGFAGILNWTVAIGPDTLKSRFQTGMVFYKSFFLLMYQLDQVISGLKSENYLCQNIAKPLIRCDANF